VRKVKDLKKRESLLKEKVSVLTHLRKNNPVLIYGEFISIENKKDSWVYARKYFDKNAIVFINNSAVSKAYDILLPPELNVKGLKSTFNTKFAITNRTVRMHLPAYSAEILL
jgi:hypothetical protein